MVSTLRACLLEGADRAKVVADCVQLIEREVAEKSGLSGLAIKAALAVVKAVKPGILVEVVDHLIDPFVARLEPFYEACTGAGAGSGVGVNQASSQLESHFTTRASQIANALLGVTDDRARETPHATLRKAYEKLRPTGKKHVEQAVPKIARVIARYI